MEFKLIKIESNDIISFYSKSFCIEIVNYKIIRLKTKQFISHT